MNQAVKWTTIKCTALALIVAAGAIGCEQPPKPKPPAPGPTFVMPPSRASAVAALLPVVSKFNEDISNFPGVTGAEHRKTLVLALEDLEKILRLINGPYQSPGFITDLTIIASAKETASMQSIPRERMVAVENQALQATSSALKELSTRYLLDKDQLPGLVDALAAKVANVVAVTGTMHDLDATDCFNSVAAVVQQMANDLKAMVPETPVPPEVPPTPVVPPTTESTPTTVPAPTSAPTAPATPTPAP